jgi:anti-sigma B factor antagonist
MGSNGGAEPNVNRDDVPRGQLLEARAERVGRAAVIELHGEMDLSTVGVAESAFAELGSKDIDTLGIDLRGLSFLDSSGLRFILEMQKRARENGWRFFVVRGSEQVHRVFDVARLDGEMTVVDSPSAGIEAGPDP